MASKARELLLLWADEIINKVPARTAGELGGKAALWAPEEATSGAAKPFAEITPPERLALRADPAAYEREMMGEAAAHQEDFRRTGKVTVIGDGDPSDSRTMPLKIGDWGRKALTPAASPLDPLNIRMKRVGNQTRASVDVSPTASAMGMTANRALDGLLKVMAKTEHAGRRWTCPEAGVSGTRAGGGEVTARPPAQPSSAPPAPQRQPAGAGACVEEAHRPRAHPHWAAEWLLGFGDHGGIAGHQPAARPDRQGAEPA